MMYWPFQSWPDFLQDRNCGDTLVQAGKVTDHLYVYVLGYVDEIGPRCLLDFIGRS